MSYTRVKICGITNIEDALHAVESGADALGFNFWTGSKRHVSRDEVKKFIREIGSFVFKVGVFVDQSLEEIQQHAKELRLDYIQLHGNESADLARKIPAKIIRVIRACDEESLKQLKGYPADVFLIDAYDTDEIGGTGKPASPELVRKAIQAYPHMVLAGGINPDNVEKVIQEFHPYSIDVCSGVEVFPGKKDHDKVKDLIQRARLSSVS